MAIIEFFTVSLFLLVARSNCNRVFMSHIGFVVVDALKPALIAETTWTKGVSRFFLGNTALIFFFEVE